MKNENERKERSKIFNDSPIGDSIKMLLVGVSGDKAKVVLSDSCGGTTWESTNKELDNEAGRFLVTTIKKGGVIVGKVIYNYDTNLEHETL